MISDPDIFLAAKLVIDQHGREADAFAERRADLLMTEDDADGALVWRRILEAIRELQRERREGDPVN